MCIYYLFAMEPAEIYTCDLCVEGTQALLNFPPSLRFVGRHGAKAAEVQSREGGGIACTLLQSHVLWWQMGLLVRFRNSPRHGLCSYAGRATIN